MWARVHPLQLESCSERFLKPTILNGEQGLSLELGWGLMSSCHPKISKPAKAQAAISSGRQEQWRKQAKHLLIFIWRWLVVRKLCMTAELSYWSVSSCGLWERPFCPGCQSLVISQKLKWHLLIAEIRERSRKIFMLGNSTRLKSSLGSKEKLKKKSA